MKELKFGGMAYNISKLDYTQARIYKITVI